MEPIEARIVRRAAGTFLAAPSACEVFYFYHRLDDDAKARLASRDRRYGELFRDMDVWWGLKLAETETRRSALARMRTVSAEDFLAAFNRHPDCRADRLRTAGCDRVAIRKLGGWVYPNRRAYLTVNPDGYLEDAIGVEIAAVLWYI